MAVDRAAKQQGGLLERGPPCCHAGVMAHNAREDVFDVGSAEARGITYMSIEDIKKLPSGDAIGKTVGQVLPSKRLSHGHRAHVLKMKYGPAPEPVTIRQGVFVDGHHRVAAGEDAKLERMPVRHTP